MTEDAAVAVDTYMSSPVYTVSGGERLEAVERQLAEHRISSVAVIDDEGRLAGVVSRSDLLRVGVRAAGADGPLMTLPDRTAADVMTRELATVLVDATIVTVARLMVDDRVHRVYVVDSERRPIGIHSARDTMLYIRDRRIDRPVSELMSSPVLTVAAEASLTAALALLTEANVSGLVVLDGRWPVGVFGQREALEARHGLGSKRVDEGMSPAIFCVEPDMLLYRAAAQMAATRVRRVVVISGHETEGILTALDFARAALP